jgi:hypothetical protein
MKAVTQTRWAKAERVADAAIRQIFEILRSALREIFDESAYARFLERQAVPSSREAYADFLREGQAARERRPRCC